MLSTLPLLITIIHVGCCNGHTLNFDSSNNTNKTSQDMCNQKPTFTHSSLAIFSSIALLVGFSANIVSITVIQTSRHLQKQIACIFVTSLAVADLGVSVFVTTVKVAFFMKNGYFCYGLELCIFLYFLDIFFHASSITHFVLIGIDRWYAIACPYAYVANMSPTKAKYTIAGVWLYSMFWSLIGIFKWDDPTTLAYGITAIGDHRLCYSINRYYDTTIIIVIYILPISITTILYTVVLQIARRHAAANTKYNLAATREDRKVQKVKRWFFNSETKAVKTVAAVFIGYTACWLPHFIVVLLSYWGSHLIIDFIVARPIVYTYLSIIIYDILPTIHSCINPFIYFICGDKFRSAIIDKYRRYNGKPRHSAFEYRLSTRKTNESELQFIDNRCVDVKNVNDTH